MKFTALIPVLIIILACSGFADTFVHRETGDVFYGFQTQRRGQGKVVVYHSEENKMITINEDEYDITLDSRGRRDTIFRIPIRQEEALISKGISERIAETIIEASNRGPQFILIEIDSPGGRGEYIRTVVEAIQQTTNCPVVTYISGGEFSGVYSAAALIALASDEVYIAPTASIGAVGPMTEGYSPEEFSTFLRLYSSDALAGYAGYAAGLVQREEVRPIARALVDKSVSLVEVVDRDDRTLFVERDNRQPTQTIVRTLAEGVSLSRSDYQEGVMPADVLGRVLMLSASDAVRIGLVDAQAASVEEIARARQIEEPRFRPAGDIDAAVRRFTAARRTIGQGLAAIAQMEEYSATLEDQISRVEDHLRTGTVTREVRRNEQPSRIPRRGRVTMPQRHFDNFFGFDFDDPELTRDQRRRIDRSARARGRVAESERIVTDQPMMSLEILLNEQVIVLQNLVAEYRRVLTQARRWPGALPPELPLRTLERNMESASAQLDSIQRFPFQFQQPQQRRRAPVQGY